MKKTVLMLEDDDDDRHITQTIFEEHRSDADFIFASNSVELFAYLRKAEPGDPGFPSLVLLNYHAAPLNAVDILRSMKENSPFSHIPVVVLSGALPKHLVRQCYAAGAASVIIKPTSNRDTGAKIGNFIGYWFHTVELV